MNNDTITLDGRTYTLIDSFYPSESADDIGRNIWWVEARDETGSGIIAYDASDYPDEVQAEDYDWKNPIRYSIHLWNEE